MWRWRRKKLPLFFFERRLCSPSSYFPCTPQQLSAHPLNDKHQKAHMSSNLSPSQPPPPLSQPGATPSATSPAWPPPAPRGFVLTTGTGRLVTPPSTRHAADAAVFLAPSPEASVLQVRRGGECTVLPCVCAEGVVLRCLSLPPFPSANFPLRSFLSHANVAPV